MTEVAELESPQTAATQVARHFTMDDNLLVSVIKSQAGSLSKALLEGVMNSIDAGASRVDVTLDTRSFTIQDDGRGFTTEDEIVNWFGRFGTPHQEGDAIYGKFRMGRGQMMAFAATEWRTGRFCMKVDIENKGLTYDLSALDPAQPGCFIEGQLYNEMTSYELRDLLTEFKQSVAYALKPVYVNGELFGEPAGGKGWTFQDENAFYKLVPESEELHIYNQGIFVCTKGAGTMGSGGVVVSKKQLKVNFARNAVMERGCAVWTAISERMTALVMRKLTSADKLSEDERRFLARRVTSAAFIDKRERLLKAKLLTDPTGRHHPLESLSKYKRFVFSDDESPKACALQGKNDTFVVTYKLLNRFGCYSAEGWLAEMRTIPGLVDPDYEVLSIEDVGTQELGCIKDAERDDLTKQQRAAHKVLEWLNIEVQLRLKANGYGCPHRELRLGKHKKNAFVAWTDGKTYVTANVPHLKLFDKGLDGISEWILTLVHEYMHDTDDSESHAHGEVFYAKFHDAVFSGNTLGLPTLCQQALLRYGRALREEGLSVPRALRMQLRPELK